MAWRKASVRGVRTAFTQDGARLRQTETQRLWAHTANDGTVTQAPIREVMIDASGKTLVDTSAGPESRHWTDEEAQAWADKL